MLRTRLPFAALGLAFSVQGCGEAPRCDGDSCGTLVVVTTADADALLPPSSHSTVGAAISDLIFLKLADLGLDLNTLGDDGFIPRLARAWQFDDSLTITFELDPLAHWDDGAPVTAQDVTFTFDVYRDSLVNALARPLLTSIVSVTALDSARAEFRFNRSYPEQFYDATHHMRILPKHLLDTIPRTELNSHEFGRNPVGNGPYRFVRWEADQLVELAADTGFFQGRPGLRRLLWRVTPDFTTAVTQVVSGEADFMEFLVTPENIERVEEASEYQVLYTPSTTYNFIGFNLTDGPSDRPHPLFGDRTLRRALAMSVDRTAVVDAVLGRYAEVPVGPASRALTVGRDTTTPQIPFDTVRAGTELRRLGWRDSDGDGVLDRDGRDLAFELLVPTSSHARRRAAVILQDQFKRMGVAVRINEVEFNLFVDRTTDRRYDTAFLGWSQDPSPLGIQQTFTSAGLGGSNYGSYRSNQFDRLVDMAINARDGGGALRLWREAFAQINADAPAIWMYTATLTTGIHRRYENVTIRPDQWSATLWTWRVPTNRQIERDHIGGP